MANCPVCNKKIAMSKAYCSKECKEKYFQEKERNQCLNCNKEIQLNQLYCSDICEENYRDNIATKIDISSLRFWNENFPSSAIKSLLLGSAAGLSKKYGFNFEITQEVQDEIAIQIGLLKAEKKVTKSNSKFCFECGNSIESHMKFCPNCGQEQ